MWREVAHYARLIRGLRDAVHYPAHENPGAILRDQLQRRETRFLELLRRIVFAHPHHPYHQIFAEARCGMGDVEQLVEDSGLEATLEILRQAGVCLSHEEFKGRQPIVRNGRHIAATSADFLNPLSPAAWQIRSSGSRSAGTAVSVSLAGLAYRECYEALAYDDFGVRNRRWITMAPILPATYGLTRPISSQKSGFRAARWFAVAGTLRDSGHYRLATQILCAELRLLGVRVPPLSFLPPNDFSPVAYDIALARAVGRLSFVSGVVSSCVRVASAALEKGLDISGARFWTAAEALTPAKAEVFRRAGAEAFATYRATELGTVGLSCPHIGGGNTVHHFRDAVAIVTHTCRAPGTDTLVNSLLFTTLLRASPFFVINLELGDHGVLQPAACDCSFSRLGFDTVITGIYSYSKLTGYGTTLVGTDILRILEEVLPARFGGSPADYQLIEQEAITGTRIVLRVNPRIGKIPVTQVRECFLSEIRKLFGGALTSRIWNHAGSLEVHAEPPIAGRTGKVLPLHLLGSSSAALKTTEAVHAP